VDHNFIFRAKDRDTHKEVTNGTFNLFFRITESKPSTVYLMKSSEIDIGPVKFELSKM
jgi:hypothetical protein